MMPVRAKESDAYTWTEDSGGLPLGAVVSYGGQPYLLVCPLCGCTHELRGQTFKSIGQQETVSPRCLMREFAGQKRERGQTGGARHTLYTAWTKTHPKAAEAEQVQAVYIGTGSKVSVAKALKELAKYAAPVESQAAA